jgi:hypothetical protein
MGLHLGTNSVFCNGEWAARLCVKNRAQNHDCGLSACNQLSHGKCRQVRGNADFRGKVIGQRPRLFFGYGSKYTSIKNDFFLFCPKPNAKTTG